MHIVVNEEGSVFFLFKNWIWVNNNSTFLISYFINQPPHFRKRIFVEINIVEMRLENKNTSRSMTSHKSDQFVYVLAVKSFEFICIIEKSYFLY